MPPKQRVSRQIAPDRKEAFMNTKIMEGLSGAATNRKLLETPMKVYQAAKHKGDTGAMERALGYAGDFVGKAQEYQEKTREGMREEAKELREKERLEREKAIEQQKLERQKERERLIGETSGEENPSDLEYDTASNAEKETTGTKPMIYTNTGEKQPAEQETVLSVRV